MRILFLHHFPLAWCEAGRFVEHCAQALLAAGHEVRGLIVDQQRAGEDSFTVERVVCAEHDGTVDLPFAMPQFGAWPGNDGVTFRELSDRQLAQYRDTLRRRLDQSIDRFDPHVIHAQHIWVQGQLALESGVPYVLSAWGPELIEYQADERYRPLADQAAENSGRILVSDAVVAEQVVATFESAADRTVLAAGGPDAAALTSAEAGHEWAAIYRSVLEARFGKAP